VFSLSSIKMSHHSEIHELEAEIDRMTAELAHLSGGPPVRPRCPSSLSNAAQPPPLRLFDHTLELPDQRAREPRPSRKETEARRFNGKESVHEYLLQFELTAKRNRWSDTEKTVNLLCALDGQARSILSEIDDAEQTTYSDVKQILTKRFGPLQHTEIHEQALRDLRLSRGQLIRELAPEAVRLAKLAYPEFNSAARERMAIQSLIQAIPDRDATFYVKEKNPGSIDEVCELYEKFRVLTGGSHASKNTVKGVQPEENKQQANMLATLLKQAEQTNQQVTQLTEAIGRLLQPPAVQHASQPSPAHPAQHPPSASSSALPAQQQQYAAPDYTRPPRPPCSICKQLGHWRRDCPLNQGTQRYSPDYSQPPRTPCPACNQLGHWRRDCPSQSQQGNHAGPVPAPGTRSAAPPRSQ